MLKVMCAHTYGQLDLIISDRGKIIISNYYSNYHVKSFDFSTMKSTGNGRIGNEIKTAYELTI